LASFLSDSDISTPNHLGQTPKNATTNGDGETQPIPTFGTQRVNIQSMQGHWNRHQQKERPGDETVSATAASIICQASYAHPDEGSNPDKCFQERFESNGADQRGNRIPPRKP